MNLKWMTREGLLGRPRYGISLDDPALVAPQRCRYDAGDARPSFEYYRPDSAYDPATGVFECEIVVPVAPL